MYNNYELLLGGLKNIKTYHLNDKHKEDLIYFLVKSIGEEKINNLFQNSLKQENVNSFIFNLFNKLKNGNDLEKALWNGYHLLGNNNLKMPLEFIFYVQENKNEMNEYNSEEILEYYFFEFFE